MKVKYSEDVDILMLQLSDKPIDNAERVGNTILHYSPEKEVVLVEIMHASNLFKDLVKEAKRVLPSKIREQLLVSV